VQSCSVPSIIEKLLHMPPSASCRIAEVCVEALWCGCLCKVCRDRTECYDSFGGLLQVQSLRRSLQVALMAAAPLLFSAVGGVSLVLRGARAQSAGGAAAVTAPRQRVLHFVLTRCAVLCASGLRLRHCIEGLW